MNLWDQLAKAVIALVVAALLLGVVVWWVPLIRHNQRLRQEKLRLETEIQKEEELQKSLRTAVEASHNDPKTVERLARTYLGYARTGEVVVRFMPVPAAAAPAPRR